MDSPLISWREPKPTPALPARKRLPLLRAATAAAPHRRDLKRELVQTLFESDRMAELVDCARPLVDRETDPGTLYRLGRAALAISNYDLAIEALRSAAESGHADAYTYLSEALLKADRIDAAIAAGLEALKHPTRDFRCLVPLARALVRSGQPERLWDLCIDLRTRVTWGGYFPAVLAATAEAIGRTDQVAAIFDSARWYSATQLGVPDDFNARLAAELLAHKSLGPAPSTSAPRGTSAWIYHLELCGGPLAQQLLVSIRTAVEDYIADRHSFTDQSVMTQRPKNAELVSWAMEARGDGFQSPHIHPLGWISGVYYVTVPPAIADGDDYAGAIEFGLLPLGDRNTTSRRARWRVMPRPGLLLLFPSYYTHWTRPTERKESRLCIAFDVVAAQDIA
jgi:tetratricopeptide (TPR) repeat protein